MNLILIVFAFSLMLVNTEKSTEIVIDDISKDILDVLEELKITEDKQRQIDHALSEIDINNNSNIANKDSIFEENGEDISKEVLDVIDILYEYTDIDEGGGEDPNQKTNTELDTDTVEDKNTDKIKNIDNDIDANTETEEDDGVYDAVDILDRYPETEVEKGIDPGLKGTDIDTDFDTYIDKDYYTDIDKDFDNDIDNDVSGHNDTSVDQDEDTNSDSDTGESDEDDNSNMETTRRSRQDVNMCLPNPGIPRERKIYIRSLIKKFVLFTKGVNTTEAYNT